MCMPTSTCFTVEAKESSPSNFNDVRSAYWYSDSRRSSTPLDLTLFTRPWATSSPSLSTTDDLFTSLIDFEETAKL